MIVRIVQEREHLSVKLLDLPQGTGPSFRPFQKFLPFRMGGLNIMHEPGIDGAILSLTPYQDRDGMSACAILAIVQGDAVVRIRKIAEQYKIRFERPRTATRRIPVALATELPVGRSVDTRLSAVS